MKTNPSLMAIVVGAGAGLAAALLFAGIATGSALSALLFYLSPLPVAIAWMGFGRTAGLAAAVAGTAVVATLAPPATNAGLFAALIVLPASWLAQQALARPRPGLTERAQAAVAPPPPSAMLVRVTIAVIIGLVTAGMVIGYDPKDRVSEWSALIADFATERPEFAQSASEEIVLATANLMVALSSFYLGALFVIIHAFVLWAAARLAMLSGLLERRWTPVPTARAPNWIAGGFLAGIAVALVVPHPAATIALVAAGACGGALILSGLAAIHALTAGRSNRGLLIFLGYLVTFFPTFPMFLWGLADSFIDFRAKSARRQSNPSQNKEY
jgi:hypothetical protein